MWNLYACVQDKLEPRFLKCVFLGYQEGTKGYWLWEKEFGGVKIIVSKDVISMNLFFLLKLTMT